jgi:hypothetical protein
MARPVQPAEKTLVVAHYRENLDWLKDVPEDVFIQVISKGEEPPRGYQYLVRPNKGREPESYLSYIVDNYDSLEGQYFFCQGRPFDHCHRFLDLLYKGTQDFIWFGNHDQPDTHTAPNGQPNHPGINIHALHRVFERGELPDGYSFFPGCQFGVTAEVIRKRPKHIYEELLSLMGKDDNEYAFERLVGHLFGDVV